MNNVAKNYDGQLEGFKRIDAAGQKQAEEAAVLAWLKKQGAAGKPALAAHAQLVKHWHQQGDPRATCSSASSTTPARRRGHHAVPPVDRARQAGCRARSGYQERDLPTIEGGLKQMDRRYVAKMDQQLQPTGWTSTWPCRPRSATTRWTRGWAAAMPRRSSRW
jgi:hypothetical protein